MGNIYGLRNKNVKWRYRGCGNRRRRECLWPTISCKAITCVRAKDLNSPHSQLFLKNSNPGLHSINDLLKTPPAWQKWQNQRRKVGDRVSNAGISKRKKTKQLTRQQRERHERGLANAERNLDKHEKKVAGSKARARRVDERRAAWEDLNTKTAVADEAEAKKISKTLKASNVIAKSNVDTPEATLPTEAAESADAASHNMVEELGQPATIPVVGEEEDIDEIT
nr:hypothetical protein CFP56_66503 [Quercus suber]